MEELTANVNWLAVVVGAVLAFLLGWVWYLPGVFGAKWAEGAGGRADASGTLAGALIVQAIGTFLLAWVVGVTAASNALFTFILVVLTIAVLVFAGGMFSGKSGRTIYIEGGCVIAMAVVMFLVQAIL